MYSKNYAREIGLHTDDRIVPLKFAVPAVGLILAGFTFGFVTSAATDRTARLNKRTPSTLIAGQTIASR